MDFKYSLAETVLIEYKRDGMQDHVMALVVEQKTVVDYFYTNKFNFVKQISKYEALRARGRSTFAITSNVYTVQDVEGRFNEFREGEILGSLQGIIDYE